MRTMSGLAIPRSLSTTSSISVSSAAKRRGIPSITGCRASRQRLVRSGKALPTASAWRWRGNGLRARYNKPGFEIFDYNIYAICGDGDLMEGIGSEAASLAGHLGLDDLCWIYDNNHITIEGKTRITFTEDVATRFLAYQWNVLRVGDANDLQRIEDALAVFRKTKDRPTLIILDSHIGYGAPHKVDTAAAHGEPLGEDEVRLAKRAYGWPENAKFLVPDGVMEHFADGIGARGAKARSGWETLFADYRAQFPDLAIEIEQMQRRELPAAWDRNLPNFPADPKGIAGRDASGQVLNVLAQNIPWLIGGAADLGPSNRTTLKFAGAGDFEPGSSSGRNLHFGIREHAMAAIVNGLSLSKLRAFGSTFMIFSDYARPAIRLSAMMELPTIFVFTPRRHGRRRRRTDAPASRATRFAARHAGPGRAAAGGCQRSRRGLSLHHAAAPQAGGDRAVASAAADLRSAANMHRRPASRAALMSWPTRPAARRRSFSSPRAARCRWSSKPMRRWHRAGMRSRVVSMPSWDIFEEQPQSYRDEVLPPAVTARVAVEQGSVLGWDRYVGAAGRIIGMKTFGASAPLKELQRKFGFEPERVVAVAMEALGRN